MVVSNLKYVMVIYDDGMMWGTPMTSEKIVVNY